MSYDLRRIGEDCRDDDDEVQHEYDSCSSFSDAESCSSDGEGSPDQDQFSGCTNSDASVYDFSSLMAQLPNSNRRGLSQYYEGKSQSFTSLSDVQCLEDLPKRENPCNIKRKMIKPCKSYADGLCESRDFAKQPSSRGSCGNLIARNNNGRDLFRPPAIPMNKNSRRLS